MKYTDQGEPIYTSQKKRRSISTKIKSRAINELNNLDLIYIMGDKPTYIHSRKAYFNAGFKVAQHKMVSLLYGVFKDRRKWLLHYADLIDQRWQEKLKKISDNLSFSEFKSIWENNIQDNGSSIFQALRELTKFKEAQTKLSAYQQKQSDIRGAYAHNANLKDINKKISSLGMQIDSVSTSGMFSWGGAAAELATEWRAIINNFTKKEIDYIISQMKLNKPQYVQLYNTILNREKTNAVKRAEKKLKDEGKNRKLTEEEIQNIKNSVTTIHNLNAQDIGNLFEYKTMGDTIMNILGNKVVSFVNVATNIKGSKKSESKTTADTLAIIQGDIDIYLSDKTSQQVQWSSTEEPILTAPTDEYFTATYSSNTDFSNLEIPDGPSSNEYKMVENLCNYVTINSMALHGNKGAPLKIDIDNFKKMVVLYGAWLRIGKAILGAPSGGVLSIDTPIGLRTMRSIYNIADLLRFFGNMTSPQILHNYLIKKDLNSGDGFYHIKSLPAKNRQDIFSKKRRIIEEVVHMHKDEEHPEYYITYHSFLSDTAFRDMLNTFGQLIQTPSINTKFSVALKNLHNIK